MKIPEQEWDEWHKKLIIIGVIYFKWIVSLSVGVLWSRNDFLIFALNY